MKPSLKNIFSVSVIWLAGANGFAQVPPSAPNAVPLSALTGSVQVTTLPATNVSPELRPTIADASESNRMLMSNVVAQIKLMALTNELVRTNLPDQINLPTNISVQSNPPQSNSPPPISSLPQSHNTSPGYQSSSYSGATGSARLDYASFRLILERNIFNPNRSRRQPGYYGEERRRPASSESFSLVGTMSYEKGVFAFFDGTSSAYRKALKPGEEIAGFKLAEIGYNKVKLASNTNEVELPIGMQMRREEEGEWSVGQQTASYSSPASSPTTPSAATSTSNAAPAPTVTTVSSTTETTNAAAAPAAEASSGGGESDVLKRLMQRREETLNK